MSMRKYEMSHLKSIRSLNDFHFVWRNDTFGKWAEIQLCSDRVYLVQYMH